MKKSLVVITVLLLVPYHVHAQDSLRTKSQYLHSGKIGLGIDDITGSPNLLMKYFFNNQFAMQVIAGFDLDMPGGTAPAGTTKVNGMTLRGGLSFLFHLTQDRVSPYVGVEGIFQYAKDAGFFNVVPDPKNSIVAGGVVGGEFFIDERFTLGIKHSLGAEIALKRDVPVGETNIKFSSATVVTGRFYFN